MTSYKCSKARRSDIGDRICNQNISRLGMRKPHVLVLPFPAQGHVIPLLELAQCLATQNLKVTFVNSEFIHKRVMSALPDTDHVRDRINFVALPDGLEPCDDRSDLAKLLQSIAEVMPRELEELIRETNQVDAENITCVVPDLTMGWALDVAKKMQIKRAAFWPASAAGLALGFNLPKMIKEGIIDENGTPLQNKVIRFSPTMPAINTTQFAWMSINEDLTAQKIFFDVFLQYSKDLELAQWLICNSANALELAAFSLFPNISPIGPLLASNRLGNTSGNFWEEDSTCLKWLDQQPPNSVIYVAFGSFTVFDHTQFQELALGLELINRRFLWVVRPDLTDGRDESAYPVGFKERVGSRGRIVDWAPQQKVLSHPSVACFLSHCGWNSTMEGISNGVPFLCWPYFADQFVNEDYICDVWKVGLRFEKDESGIIQHGEIKDKVEQLLGDKTFRERAIDFKDEAARSVKEGGCSYKNLRSFIKWIKI